MGDHGEEVPASWAEPRQLEAPHLLPRLGTYALPLPPNKGQFQGYSLEVNVLWDQPDTAPDWPPSGLLCKTKMLAGGCIDLFIPWPQIRLICKFFAYSTCHLLIWSGCLFLPSLPGLYVWGPVCEPTVCTVSQCILFWLLDFGNNSKWHFQPCLKHQIFSKVS